MFSLYLFLFFTRGKIAAITLWWTLYRMMLYYILYLSVDSIQSIDLSTVCYGLISLRPSVFVVVRRPLQQKSRYSSSNTHSNATARYRRSHTTVQYYSVLLAHIQYFFSLKTIQREREVMHATSQLITYRKATKYFQLEPIKEFASI